MPVTLSELPLWLNLLIFMLSAGLVWFAGSKLARYAETISDSTGLSKAFIGALLLGGITSLPELATTISASAIGNASLAVSNLFGGVAMQVAILAVADATLRAKALSRSVKSPTVALQGMLLILMLAVAAAGIAIGDAEILGFGLWTSAILVIALYAFYLTHKGQEAATPQQPQEAHGAPLGSVWLKVAAAAAAILLAGFALAQSGDVLAVQTGLGSSFVGAVLVAISTSLPELSTTLSAVFLGQYTLAFSNIFGTNILDVSGLFLADAVYQGGPVLNEVSGSALVAAGMGAAVTAVYLLGLKRKAKPRLLNMGADSLLVLALYLAGVILLYVLR